MTDKPDDLTQPGDDHEISAAEVIMYACRRRGEEFQYVSEIGMAEGESISVPCFDVVLWGHKYRVAIMEVP